MSKANKRARAREKRLTRLRAKGLVPYRSALAELARSTCDRDIGSILRRLRDPRLRADFAWALFFNRSPLLFWREDLVRLRETDPATYQARSREFLGQAEPAVKRLVDLPTVVVAELLDQIPDDNLRRGLDSVYFKAVKQIMPPRPIRPKLDTRPPVDSLARNAA